MTLQAVFALDQISTPGLETKVVVGATNPHFDVLQRTVLSSKANMNLMRTVTNLPD